NSNELNYAARERIDSYTSTAGIRYDLLHTELAVFKSKGQLKAFRDYKVHDVLKRSGIKQKFFDTNKKQNEWFQVDLETAKLAIKAVKEGKKAIGQETITEGINPIIFRPEQRDAIDKTIKQFKKHDRMLWNAKMRFGKTLSALQVAKEMKFNRSIIVTHRPVVSEGWFDDFNKIFYDKPEYKFGSHKKGESIQNLILNEDKFVYFASIQDLRGSSQVGGNYEKNSEIYKTNWDFIVVDEAHEGTQTDLGKSVIEALSKPYLDYKTKILELSGTPFNILSDYEEDNIYTWDYIMEQEAKMNWSQNTFGDSNPYAELPKMNIYTYHLETSLAGFMDVEDKAFNFREFFRIWTGDIEKDGKHIPTGKKVGDFVHEEDVNSFLNLITKESNQTNYPFSTKEYREYFRHSLWMLPGVKEAKAFSKLLKKHKIFGSGLFEIINVAGDGDEEVDSKDALKAVQDAIGKNPDETYSITLSCGRLTTGVSVPEWTAVLMLAGSFSTAASQYLQTIFRVQTPANINGKIKENCYVFDFAPDRTLKMVAEAVQLSARSSNSLAAEIQLGKFLNFCPIISVDDTKMKEFKVANLLQELKRAYAERVVKNGFDDIRLYNDELLKLDDIQLTEFMDLKKVIGVTKQTKKVEDITINDEGFTDEKYEQAKKLEKKPKRQLTEAEKALLEEMKEKKKNRSTAISILRGISIRIPLLVYGANIDINDDVTIDNFASLVDDLSWEEFMPKGVDKNTFDKFAKYYDKDVFLASSRRIRFISKSADELEPTERVKKIASLFASFKNPDKETVLTPWRTVNMHLSDTIGGYDFFDENHDNEIQEPRFVDQGEVTKDVLLNDETNVLEINSKSGLYPLYVTYSIYKNKINNLDESEHTFDNKIKLWDDTVQNNIFVICKTPMAKSITKRTLVGYRDISVNTHYFEDLINQLKQKNKLKTFIRKVKNGSSYWKVEGKKDNMKFNAVVGNPPYQEIVENREEQPPVYHYFYDAAISLSSKVTLITPGRFLFDVGKTPSTWNRKMLQDEHFKVVRYFENSRSVFPTVDIKGGVAISLRDTQANFGAIKVFITNDNLKSVMNKVLSKTEKSISDIMYSNTSYKYSDLFFNENEGFYDRVSGGSRRYLSSSVFDKFPEAFFNEKPNDGEKYARIIGRKDSERVIYYFKEKYLQPPTNYSKYKVFLASSNGSGRLGESLSTPLVAKPYLGATETFVSFGKFDSLYEAES
ncbi:MAG: Eco57I restriction-modification methylase domain-containing protein, partial [Acholeplasma sp.]|nr:Eco57I restriction-modification methylase domain-containing protein [Acholeplasma sp.]